MSHKIFQNVGHEYVYSHLQLCSGIMSQEVGKYTVSLQDILGNGSYGIVYQAVHSDSNLPVVAKQITFKIQQKRHHTAEKELMAFHQLPHDHQNIIKILNIHKDNNKNLWIIMERCVYGDLMGYFNKYPEKFDDTLHKLQLMCQISNGLEYLHEKKIVHRDIKPYNILLHDKNNKTDGLSRSGENIVAKIADFGLCKFLDPLDTASSMSSNVGTQYYKAPEFWDPKSNDRVRYHKSIDIFAAGLTFLSMIQPLEDGLMKPKIEVGLLEEPLNNPIGLTMLNRKAANRPVNILADTLEDDEIINGIRKIIAKAIVLEPRDRITADALKSGFETLNDSLLSCLAEMGELNDDLLLEFFQDEVSLTGTDSQMSEARPGNNMHKGTHSKRMSL